MSRRILLTLLLLSIASHVGLTQSGVVPVLSQQGGKPRILFDESHSPFEWTIGGGKVSFTTSDGFLSLAAGLRSVGFQVDSFKRGPITSRDLESISVLVVPPSNVPLSTVEESTVLDFVRKGGGLLLFGENSYTGDKALATTFGITPANAVVCDPVYSLPIMPFHIRIWNMTFHEVTKGVGSYIFDWGQPLIVRSPAVALAYVGNQSWTETDYDGVRQLWEGGKDVAVLAAANYDLGRVVVTGDSGGFMNYGPIGWNGLDQFDTRSLALNIFNWLARQELFGPSLSYIVTVTSDSAPKHLAHVKISITGLHTPVLTLAMNRWHDGQYYQMLVTGFSASDGTGATLPHEFSSQALRRSWTVQAGNATSMNVEYDVILNFVRRDFDQYAGYLSQRFGISEGAGLFALPEDMPIADLKVGFILPQSWAAYAPWTETSDNTFLPENTQSFMWSTLAVGTFTESSKRIGNSDVRIAVHSSFDSSTQKSLADYSFKAYEYMTKVFGKSAPLERYLAVWVPAADDGRGICELEWSSSQGIVTDARPNINYNEYVHRVFHTWNAFEPTGMAWNSGEELWFVEGTNTYYDDKTVVELGIKQELTVMTSYLREYLTDYVGTQYDVPLSQAYKYANSGDFNKYNWLYYHKGALVSYLLDKLVMNITKGNRSFDDLLKLAYARYGGFKGALANTDLIQMLNSITGFDFSPFFQKFVFGTDKLPLKTQGAGLAVDWVSLSRMLNFSKLTTTWTSVTSISQTAISMTAAPSSVSVSETSTTASIQPLTGASTPEILYVAGAACAIAVAGIVLLRKRKTIPAVK